MKKSCFAFLSVAAIVLVTASSAFATATVTVQANGTISADTVGGSTAICPARYSRKELLRTLASARLF